MRKRIPLGAETLDQEAMERLYHMRVAQLGGLPAEVYELYSVVHCGCMLDVKHERYRISHSLGKYTDSLAEVARLAVGAPRILEHAYDEA